MTACPPPFSFHGVPTLPQPSSASTPLPLFLLGFGAHLTPQLLESAQTTACAGYACILSPVSSSSLLHPHPHSCTLILSLILIPVFHTQLLSSAPLYTAILDTALTTLWSFSYSASTNACCGCHHMTYHHVAVSTPHVTT